MGRANSLQRKSYLICTIIILITTVCLLFQPQNQEELPTNLQYIIVDSVRNGTEIEEVQKWFQLRSSEPYYSKLGRILYLDEEEPQGVSSSKRYQILVWKYGYTIEFRHLKSFSNKLIDPFEFCPVKNCDITYEKSALTTADIVIFHLHRMKGTNDVPEGARNPNQIWAFLTDESPHHTFLKSGVKLTDFNGVFNWSMSYRKDSDIPVPYGRTVIKKNPEHVELALDKRRDVLIAILGSNCGGKNHRWEYVRELQKHIKVDVYGGCGTLKTCPGHFRTDCHDIDQYLFYLSFENSNCDDYITEKLWWNAFEKNSIPIVMGAQKINYETLLPPNSYINVEEFASPAVLAQFLYRLNSTEEYKDYFKWKQNFEVLNEHGFFKSKSFHYCRICQAMNYNDKSRKTYTKLEDFGVSKKIVILHGMSMIMKIKSKCINSFPVLFNVISLKFL